MTLVQLRSLIAIVDAGLNITLAAQRVHATQPGLSKQLSQLESELGFPIFRRRGKSLAALTPEGENVLARARNVLREAAGIRALAVDLRRDNGGLLRIAGSPTHARHTLPRALGLLRDRLPGVGVRVRPTGREDAKRRLARGDVDVALISTTGTPPADGLALPLYRFERVALIRERHALAAIEPLTLKALARENLVSYDSAMREDSSLHRAFAAVGDVPKLACTTNDADLIKTYVHNGIGVGIVAEMAAEEPDGLVVRSLEKLVEPCVAWLVVRDDRALSTPVEALIGLLAPHIDVVSVRRRLGGDGGQPVVGPVPTWQQWNGAQHAPPRATAAAVTAAATTPAYANAARAR